MTALRRENVTTPEEVYDKFKSFADHWISVLCEDDLGIVDYGETYPCKCVELTNEMLIFQGGWFKINELSLSDITSITEISDDCIQISGPKGTMRYYKLEPYVSTERTELSNETGSDK